MNIVDEVREILRKEYLSGMTQTQIAEKYHLKQSHVSNILNGKKKISLEMLEEMFPKMTINFNSGIINNGTNSGVISIESRNVMDKIINSDDLTAEEKIKVLKVLKK